MRPSCPCALSWAGPICARWRPIRVSQLCRTCRRSTESWRSCRCLMMNLCSQTLQLCLWIVGIWVRVGQRYWLRDSADSAGTGRPGPSHPPLAFEAQPPRPLHISAVRWDTAQYVPEYKKYFLVFFNMLHLHVPLLMSNSENHFLNFTKPIQEHEFWGSSQIIKKKSYL